MARAASARRPAPRGGSAPERERDIPLLLGALSVFAVAVAAYANSLGGPLLFDDVNAIVDNPAVRRPSAHAIFLTPSWWGKYASAYRPLTTLSFAADHALHGLDPFGYHLVNVLVHGGVTVLVGLLLLRLTRDRMVALVAALLFATHPVHTEAVASVVGRAELLAAGFCLGAWLVLLGTPATGVRPSLVRTSLAALLFLAGILAKESGVGFLAAIVAADAIYAPDRRPWPVLRSRWPAYAVLALSVVGVVAIRTAVLGGVTPTVDRLDNVLAGAPAVTRVMTALSVLARYAHRLVWPFTLSADYSYAQITLAESPADPFFLQGLAIVVGGAGLAAWGWRHAPTLVLALASTATTFALVSNLIVPIGTIMAERLLYAPSIGFCLALAAGIVRVGRGRMAPLGVLLGYLLGFGLTAAYGAGTLARNRVWGDRLRFFETMVRDAPDSARSHRELAIVYDDLGQAERARAELRIALRLDPDNAVTLYNLGNVELRARRFDEAVTAYQAALEKNPRDVGVLTNLGNAYSARGDEPSAETWFRRGLAVAPQSAALRVNLANALLRQGKLVEAEREYRLAVEQLPLDPLPRFNYGICLEALGRFGDAVEQYRAALPQLPDGAGVMVRLVAALAASGRLTEAMAQQAEAEARFPGDPRVRQTRQLLSR